MVYKNFLIALAIGVTGSASADLIVTESSAPTTNLSGFTTYTLNLTTDTGQITSLQGEFDGPMNQVNPAGNSTVFTNNNDFFGFVGAEVDQDSQFLFNSNDLLVITQFTEEGPTTLQSAFTGFPGFVSRDVVQLVIPDGQIVDYIITAVVNGEELQVSGTTPVPEPGSLALLGLGGAMLFARRRRAAQAV